MLAEVGLLLALLEDVLHLHVADGALVLDVAAGTALGRLLVQALLVLAAVQHSPGNLARVLALLEERLALAVQEDEHAA